MKVKIISWNGCVISRCILQTVCWSCILLLSSYSFFSLSCRLQIFYYYYFLLTFLVSIDDGNLNVICALTVYILC
jgi:hypothetical protein